MRNNLLWSGDAFLALAGLRLGDLIGHYEATGVMAFVACIAAWAACRYALFSPRFRAR